MTTKICNVHLLTKMSKIGFEKIKLSFCLKFSILTRIAWLLQLQIDSSIYKVKVPFSQIESMFFKGSLFLQKFIKISTLSDFSSIFPTEFLQPKLRNWTQISTRSQSQAPDRNSEEKWKKNQISVFLYKPFWEKALFKGHYFSDENLLPNKQTKQIKSLFTDYNSLPEHLSKYTRTKEACA